MKSHVNLVTFHHGDLEIAPTHEHTHEHTRKHALVTSHLQIELESFQHLSQASFGPVAAFQSWGSMSGGYARGEGGGVSNSLPGRRRFRETTG